MGQCKISVIVPVYNVAAYLPQCLDSIINQTLTDIEIVCVNDGSTDASPAILEAYAKNDARIIVIHQENAGQSAARNAGIAMASGEYLAFVDADDWVDHALCQQTYAAAKQHDADMVMFYHATVDNNNGKIDTTLANTKLPEYAAMGEGRVFNWRANAGMVFIGNRYIWNRIFRTELIKKHDIKFPEGYYFEDNAFFFDTYLRAERVVVLRKVFYFYRICRMASTTGSIGVNHFDMIPMMRHIHQTLKTLNIYPELNIAFLNFYIRELLDIGYGMDLRYREKYAAELREEFLRLHLQADEIKRLSSYARGEHRKMIASNRMIYDILERLFTLTVSDDRLVRFYVLGVKFKFRLKPAVGK